MLYGKDLPSWSTTDFTFYLNYIIAMKNFVIFLFTFLGIHYCPLDRFFYFKKLAFMVCIWERIYYFPFFYQWNLKSTGSCYQILKVESCKLYNKKYMIASTQITNIEIFAFIAVLVFKLLSCNVLCVNRKNNRNY